MSVSVIAVGMVTALGLDWETSCAASRAGIRRASKLDHFPFQTAEIGEPRFATGHEVDLLTKGFEGFGRLLRLLTGAMRDIRTSVTTHPELLQHAGFYLSMPDPERTRRASSSREVEDLEPYSRPDQFAVRLVVQSCQHAQWPFEPRLKALSLTGHAGFAEVLKKALDDIESGRATTCVVGGVDSLLDEDTLTWLVNSDRLKHPANEAGLMPGEGCALLLVSKTSGPMTEICSVGAVRMGQEQLAFLDDKPADGKGLWLTAEGVISDCSKSLTSVLSLTSDHNGEVYRARELGGMLVRLRKRIGNNCKPHILFPAISFGDTGAASGALGVASVAHSFGRRYASADNNITLSTSDGTPRGAVLLTRAASGGNNGS